MTNVTKYKGFDIETPAGQDASGKTYYTYKITGNGLSRSIETSEHFDDEATALAFARDFVDEHL